MNRAYSILTVKSVSEDRRVIAGIATTPEPDRQGDIVEPKGVGFKNPLPLLLHHDHQQPVGRVTFKTATAAGIPFEASIPFIEEPGRVKDRVDEAWHSVKSGLIAGVSIGFRVLEDGAEMLASGGMRFLKTEVLELSLVTIPANASATITTIKSLDQAASGHTHTPGVTGSLPVVRARKDAPATMTITEQIAQFDSTRQTKSARQIDLMTKAAAAGVTLDQAETEEYDTLKAEISAIDAHLVRLRDMEKSMASTATPVSGGSSQQAADTRNGIVTQGGQPIVQVKSMLPKGTAFTRMAIAKARAKGDPMYAIEVAKQWRDSTPEVETYLKAAIAAGTTTDATFAAPLMPAAQALTGEFIDLLRPATLIGKMPNLRRVPFNISVATQTAGGTYGWVGQGKPKPLTNNAFSTVTLLFNKIAGIIVLTEELVKFSSPAAEETVRNDMVKGIATFMDAQFIDPSVAASGTVSPASITNGTSAIASVGTSADNAKTDIKALIATFVAANLSTQDAILIMSEANAFALGVAVNPLGQPLFPGLGAMGGTIMGIPVITSQTAGTNVILVDQQGILFADDGGVNIDVSREASLQMDSAPDDPVSASTVMVSLWQQNMVGLRAERFCTWKRARTASVKYTSGAAYV